MTGVGRLRALPALRDAGWLILAGAAMVWLTVDTLGYRLSEGPLAATVVLNLQFTIGAAVLVMLVIAMRWMPAPERDDHAPPRLGAADFGWGLVALIGLWLGSLEVDRAFADEAMAAQAGLSVYWAIFGVALVVAGFVFRTATARYAGLALLAITVIKVVLVDLSTVERAWRVISFFASGLLLVGTSVLYSKLSPRLLEERDDD
jgi:uncharacterized membrane protein